MVTPQYSGFAPQGSGPAAPLSLPGLDFVNYTYPVDLGDNPGQRHYVVFFVNETKQTGFTYTPKNIQNYTSKPKNPIASVITANGANLGTTSQLNQNNKQLSSIPHLTRRAPLAICLYMPPSISTSQQLDWGQKELGSAGDLVSNALAGDRYGNLLQAIKGIAASVGAFAVSNANIILTAKTLGTINALDPISRSLSIALNPHAEVLFNGVAFRTFQFDFKFTPRSDDESVVVYNIIQAFKFYAAPEFLNGLSPFWVYPAEFDIKFFSNGKPNDFLNKISTCALVNISVNYCADGIFSSFHPGKLNGVTVDTILTLNFMELELMTKHRIIEGY